MQQQDLAFDLRIDPALLSKVLNNRLGCPESLMRKLSGFDPLGVTYETLKAWKQLDGKTEAEEAAILAHLIKTRPELYKRFLEQQEEVG